MKKENNFQNFQVSQVGVLIRGDKCLILKFALNSKRWGLPGGRVDAGEFSENAFKREIKEELDIDDFKIISVLDYDLHYTERGTGICGIASLIENDNDKISLSYEHSQLKWVTKEELKDYDFIWPSAKRMLEKGFEYKEKNKI